MKWLGKECSGRRNGEGTISAVEERESDERREGKGELGMVRGMR